MRCDVRWGGGELMKRNGGFGGVMRKGDDVMMRRKVLRKEGDVVMMRKTLSSLSWSGSSSSGCESESESVSVSKSKSKSWSWSWSWIQNFNFHIGPSVVIGQQVLVSADPPLAIDMNGDTTWSYEVTWTAHPYPQTLFIAVCGNFSEDEVCLCFCVCVCLWMSVQMCAYLCGWMCVYVCA